MPEGRGNYQVDAAEFGGGVPEGAAGNGGRVEEEKVKSQLLPQQPYLDPKSM